MQEAGSDYVIVRNNLKGRKVSNIIDFVKELFMLTPEETKQVGLMEFKRKKTIAKRVHKPIETEASLSGLRRRKTLQ